MKVGTIGAFNIEIPEYLDKSYIIPVIITDLEGNIIYINNAYTHFFGFEKKELCGEKIISQLLPDDLKTVLDTVEKCIKEPESVHRIQLRKPKKNKKDYIITEWELSAIHDEYKDIKGIFCLGKLEKIVYRPEGEKYLSEYQNIVDNLTNEAWSFYDSDLRLRMLNKRALEIAKHVFNSVPMPGDHALLYVRERDLSAMKSSFDRALKGETVQNEFTTTEGESYLITIKPVYGRENKLYGIAHYCLDVTNLRRQQAAVEQLSKKYRILINQINGLVLTIDNQGNITFISEKVYELSGFTPEQVVGKPFEAFVHPEDMELSKNTFKDIMVTGQSAVVALRTANSDGRYEWSLTRAALIEEDGKPYVLAVMLKIEDIKQKDAIIESYHRRMEKIAFLQSHVVRAPLARLLALTDAVYTELVEDCQELEKFILYIKEAALELDRVIHKIVDMTYPYPKDS